MSKLTDFERLAICNLADNDFTDGVPPEKCPPIWCDSINDSPWGDVPSVSLGGVIASLVKKGMVKHCDDETLSLTPDGAAAYRRITMTSAA